MKLCAAIIIAVFFSLSAKAQHKDLFKRKPMEEYKLKRLLQDTLDRIHSVPHFKQENSAGPATPDDPGVVRFPLKGKFIGENGKGDEIYAMQPDNMPCLVPGKKIHFNMPVAGGEKVDKNLLPLLRKGEEKTGGLENGSGDK